MSIHMRLILTADFSFIPMKLMNSEKLRSKLHLSCFKDFCSFRLYLTLLDKVFGRQIKILE